MEWRPSRCHPGWGVTNEASPSGHRTLSGRTCIQMLLQKSLGIAWHCLERHVAFAVSCHMLLSVTMSYLSGADLDGSINRREPQQPATSATNKFCLAKQQFNGICLRENLQDSPIFNGKIDGFRFRFSLKFNQSIFHQNHDYNPMKPPFQWQIDCPSAAWGVLHSEDETNLEAQLPVEPGWRQWLNWLKAYYKSCSNNIYIYMMYYDVYM